MSSAQPDIAQPGAAPEIAAIYADFLELAPESVRVEAIHSDLEGELLVSVFGTATRVETRLVESGDLALAHRHRDSIHALLADRLKEAAAFAEGGRKVVRVSAAMDFEADAERLSFTFAES